MIYVRHIFPHTPLLHILHLHFRLFVLCIIPWIPLDLFFLSLFRWTYTLVYGPLLADSVGPPDLTYLAIPRRILRIYSIRFGSTGTDQFRELGSCYNIFRHFRFSLRRSLVFFFFLVGYLYGVHWSLVRTQRKYPGG